MKAHLPFASPRSYHLIFVSACLAMLCMLWPGYAAAHRAMVFAWVEGETVHTESKFSGGKRVNRGNILVYDLDGNPLLSGKTDEQGNFSFKIPKKTGMKIVLQAGMGHRGEWTLPLSEIAPQEPKPDPPVPQEEPSATSQANEPAFAVSLDQIRSVVDQCLDQRLNPVLRALAQSRVKGPTLRDILGGLGYILGLMGLAAYIHFRRKARDLHPEGSNRISEHKRQ